VKKEVILTDRAETDITEAATWYEHQKLNLGTEFLKSFEETLEFVSLHPKTCPKKHKNFRGAVVHFFLYVMIYEEEKNKIIIYRVLHTKRNPAKRKIS